MPRVICATYEIIEYPENVLEKIEKAARTCYKSEDRITKTSSENLVKSLIRRGHMAMIEFGGVLTVKFISNRGFTHELVRHRLSSFAQESTRYCNYGKGKFGSLTTVIDPSITLSMRESNQDKCEKWKVIMLDSWIASEGAYLNLVYDGCPAEIAREVLPIGLKAEIVIQANVREWRHIFSQRTSNAAHPRMREVMRPLLVKCRELMPVIFDDVGTTE